MNKAVIVGRVFRHYRNQEQYQVMDCAVNPNTQEQIVVYRSVRGNRADGKQWWRPMDEFKEKFK